MFSNKITQQNSSVFSCESCHFNTCNKKDYTRHLQTKKHSINVSQCLSMENSQKNQYACGCGKIYKDNSGLWRHKKKCVKQEETNSVIEPENKTDFQLLAELFKIQLTENHELKELMKEQYKENVKLQQQLIEMAKEGKTINNTTNNTSSNNFNLQFFLNEQCKDALNIMDFINQLQINTADLDMVGRVGYAEGISKIFIRGLKALDIFKRPLHCSDLKREVVYVKDKDSWEKDDEDKKAMKNAIKFIAAKNFNMLNDWIEDNPEYNDYESKKHKEYHNIILKASGGATPEEDEKNYNKIIRNVAHEITIDKSSDR